MNRTTLLIAAIFTFASVVIGCLPDHSPAGLRRTPAGDGPLVRFEIEGRPLPEMPFPNDLVTRADTRSPTGLRLNLSMLAPTEAERTLRERAQNIDGFGTFAPITVTFDRPLDTDTLDGRGRPYADDPVVLVDLTEGPHFGERVDLDLGRGNFPVALPRPDAYFDHDPRAGESNLVFETVDEDLDGDGRLSSEEDTDGDGVLDRPNTRRPDGHRVDDLVTFFEFETNTLILRPVVPLRSGHNYAVVITETVVGRDGQAVRSPFDYVHHTRQSRALERLPDALAMHGVEIGDVAFTWSFTTQTAVRELVDLRRGIAGHGPFAVLAERAPPDVTRVEPLWGGAATQRILLRTDDILTAFAVLGPFFPFLGGVDREVIDHFVTTYQHVDYLVAGRFATPYLLGDDDKFAAGRHPADDDEHFRLDSETGHVVIERAEVPFWCTVPRPRPEASPPIEPPYPVVLFAHGFGGTRIHALGVSGTLARWGFATCAIDAVGHGMPLSEELAGALDALLATLGLEPFREVLEGFRARDLNNDGAPDSGGDTFTTDPFHTRDIIRQTALDWMQFIRVLRAFDGKRRWALPGVGVLAGDFDRDGAVDFGGPDVEYHFSGISYGGLISGIVGGVEPYLSSVFMIAGGGGLADIGLRSTQAGVPEAVVLRAMGPFIMADAPQSGISSVRFFVNDVTGTASLPFAELPALVPGDRVVLSNLESGDQKEARVAADGAFRVAVAADAVAATALRGELGLQPAASNFDPPPLANTSDWGDRLRLDIFDGAGPLKYTVETFERDVTFNGVVFSAGQPLVAVTQGWGIVRQSPEMRRFAQITQMLIEPADPVNYARHHFLEPIEYGAEAPGAPKGVNLCVLVTAGDTQVPAATGFSFARAAGALEWRGDNNANDVLIEKGVVEGLARLRRFGDSLFDVDDLSDGSDDTGAQRLDPPLRVTVKRKGGGHSGLRVALLDPRGQHGFGFPRPDKAWDGETYLANLMGRFFSRGVLDHEACLTDSTCDDVPPGPPPPSD